MNPLQLGTLDKAEKVLDLYGRNGEALTFTEIVEQTGLEKGSVQRLLYSLQKAGFLIRHERYKRYSLSPRFLSFAVSYIQNDPVIIRALPLLEEMAHRTNQSVGLSVLDGTDTFYIKRIPNLVSHDFALLPVRRLACVTAAGRAIMANLEDQEIETIFSSAPIRSLTSRTIVDIDKLRDTIRQVRKDGFAFQDGEVLEQEIGIAAAVLGEGNRPVAAVSISIDRSRFSLNAAKKKFSAIAIAVAQEMSSDNLPSRDLNLA